MSDIQTMNRALHVTDIVVCNPYFCHAFANGKKLQYYSFGQWINYSIRTCDEEFGPWFYNKGCKWRIKPEICYYRVCLFKNESAFNVTTNSDTEFKALENIHSLSNNFVKWLTDWVEYEVQEED